MADAGLTEADWLARVPDLLRECADEWELRLGEPYPRGAAAYTVRAESADGTPAVLKLFWLHRETEHLHQDLHADDVPARPPDLRPEPRP